MRRRITIAILVFLLACNENSNSIMPGDDGISGCVDSNALNYNPDATEDDFSCIYSEGSQICNQNIEVCLSLQASTNNNQSALNYTSSKDIAGFQFNHNGCVQDAGDGDAAINGFSIATSPSAVLGFSFVAAVIPSGNGTLILLEGEITENCISNIVFSGPNGEDLSIDWSSK